MILKHQAETFLKVSQTRRRAPARPATLAAYRSYIDNWIVPVLGNDAVVDIKNRQAKQLVDRMTEAGLAPRTVNAVVNCLKAIVASVLNADGEELYPRTWNSDFMDLPAIPASDAPVIVPETLLEAISRAGEQDRSLYGLLAGTGLRIGEALSISQSDEPGLSFWDVPGRVIHVRSTLNLQDGHIQPAPKTQAGVRQVDVHPELNDFLRVAATGGLLFRKDGKPLVYSTLARRARRNGITEGFHAFRRFRVTHLESQNVPRGLVQYWTGHANQTVTDSYNRVGRNLDIRRRECERAGLGFPLP